MNSAAAWVRLRAPRVARISGVLAVLFLVIGAWCTASLENARGAIVRPCDPAPAGAPIVLLTPELSRAPLNPRFKPEGCVIVSGFWVVRHAGVHTLRVVADGGASLAIDGQPVAARTPEATGRSAEGSLPLEVGTHSFAMRFEPAGPAQLRAVVVDASGAHPLGPAFVRAPSSSEEGMERGRSVSLQAAAVFVAIWLIALALSPGAGRAAFAVFSLAFLLRFETLVARYSSTVPGPVTQAVYGVAHNLRPDTWAWEKEMAPYAGNDPIHYIEFAKQMPGFFDAHVREPLFVGLSRLFIVGFGFGDAGISVLSMFASCALVGATFVYGYQRFGKTVALVASSLLAIDVTETVNSVEGWRDGLFATSFVIALWALDRLRSRPSTRGAVLVGTILGLSCLIRLSALSFVAVALFDLAFFGRAPVRQRLKLAGVAFVVAGLLLGPYLATCAIAFGDPLYAINYHLRFYQPGSTGAGESAAASYLFSSHDLLGRADTLFEGLTSYPFLAKWRGLELWFGAFTALIAFASAFGVASWLLSAVGLRIAVLTAAALVPFAFTWVKPGGAEYRFTLLAYPVYLLAAGWTFEKGLALSRGVLSWRRAASQTTKVVFLTMAIFTTGVSLRRARLTSDGLAAHAFTITAGPRDAMTAGGFGWPRYTDRGFVRVSSSSSRSIHLSLQPGRPWVLTLQWRSTGAAQVREGGQRIDDLPPAGGEETRERSMALPPSESTERILEIVGESPLEFLSARFSIAPATPDDASGRPGN